MKKWVFVPLLFALSFLNGCMLSATNTSTNNNATTTNPITSSSTSTTEPITTITTTTTELPLPPAGEELRDRIQSLFYAQEASAIIQIDSQLKAIIHYDSIGLDVVHLESLEVDTFDLDNHYYYGAYSDNQAHESWMLIQPLDDNQLIQNTNDNGHLMISTMSASNEDIFESAFNPYSYFISLFTVADFEKEDEFSYSIYLPYKTLIQDPIYGKYFRNLSKYDKIFNNEAYVTVDYQFMESSLWMQTRFVVFIDDSLANAISVTLTSTLSFLDSMTPFTYDISDYYLDSYDSIQLNMRSFALGDSVKVYAYENRINIVKLHLEPGYYIIGSSIQGNNTIESYLLDSSGNQIDRNPYFIVRTSGDYYYHWDDSENIKRIIPLSQLPIDQIGTLDSPILSGPVLSGSIDIDSGSKILYHLLAETSPGFVIKITPIKMTGNRLYVMNHSTGYYLSLGDPTYIVIEAGNTPFVVVYSNNDCDYELTWEIIPFGSLETNIADMPSIPLYFQRPSTIHKTPIAFLGNEYSEINLKFEIQTAGVYRMLIDIIDETGFWEHDNIIPDSQVFNEFGELLVGAGPFLYFEYEVGTYYLNLKWYEGEYVIYSGYLYLE